MILNTLEKYRIYLVYVPLTLYWIFLFIATTVSVETLPTPRVSDKLLHFAAFAVLVVLLDLTARIQSKNPWIKSNHFIFTYVLIMIYGAFDEIHQYFIPGRSADYMDWIADMAGAATGVILLHLFLLLDLKFVEK